jgi:hypothetical protein
MMSANCPTTDAYLFNWCQSSHCKYGLVGSPNPDSHSFNELIHESCARCYFDVSDGSWNLVSVQGKVACLWSLVVVEMSYAQHFGQRSKPKHVSNMPPNSNMRGTFHSINELYLLEYTSGIEIWKFQSLCAIILVSNNSMYIINLPIPPNLEITLFPLATPFSLVPPLWP